MRIWNHVAWIFAFARTKELGFSALVEAILRRAPLAILICQTYVYFRSQDT
jgi:hypothetical protein